MQDTTSSTDLVPATAPAERTPRPSIRARAGAAGKALIVYLASGSVGVAIVAYLLFRMMGC